MKGSAGVLEWNRSPDGAPKLWVEDWEIEQPISVPWKTMTARDAPPEAVASGHGGRDYYGFAVQPLTSTPPRIDSSEAVAGDFCGYEQFVPGFGDDAERDAWYRRMFAAPYHVDGSTQVFCAATDRIRRLLERNEPGAEVLSPEGWAERSIRERSDDECTDRGGRSPRRRRPCSTDYLEESPDWWTGYPWCP